MTGPRARLAIVAAFLAAGLIAFWVLDLVSTSDVRGAVEPFGPAGPLVYVAIAGVLGALLVPGPVLAGAAGLLFGPAVGTLASVASATTSATIGVIAGRRAGGTAVEDVAGPRVAATTALVRRHGFPAVVVQRLAPGVPDGPCNWAFGLAGLRVRDVAAGTVVGSAPRAFAYAALGGSLDEPGSTLFLAGIATLAATGLAGLAVATLAWRRAADPLPQKL